MVHRLSLFSYLLSIILISSSIVLAIVIIGNRSLVQRILLSHQEEKFEFMTQSASEEIELRLTNVEGAIDRNGLLFKEEDAHSRETAIQILNQTLDAFPTIFAMEIIFTEEETDQKAKSGFEAIYAYREKQEGPAVHSESPEEIEQNQVTIVDRTDIETDYKADWFTKPVIEKKAVWSPPYKDPQIGVWMITYSVPVFSSSGNIEAVMTADVSLEWLNQLINSFPIGLSGEPVLVTPNQIIYRSGKKAEQAAALEKGDNQISLIDIDQNISIGGINAEKQESKHPASTSLADFLAQSKSGKIRYTPAGTHSGTNWFYYSTLPKISWKLGCVIPERSINKTIYRMTKRVVLFGLCGILLLIIPSFFIARSVARPLSILSRCANDVACGNFDEKLPSITGDGEISQLFNAFDSMRGELKRHIHDITEATKKEENINSQLRIAHSIQQGMVPKKFESAHNTGLDLFAQMKPAQDVGGDLYDYAVLEDGKVYFCLGDVSGKGIPASIFMAIGKTLIRSAVLRDGDPARALSWVNNQLLENDDEGLFITVLCGIYSIKDREILVSCAGHNPPFIRFADGKTKQIDITNAKFPLAVIDDVEYENFKIQLPPGSTFFTYSDGVTDAADPEGNFFGTAKLQKYLSEGPNDSAKTLVESIMKELVQFADGAKQSDDITILAFREIS